MRTETRHSLILLVGTGLTSVISLIYAIYAQRVMGPAISSEFVAVLSLVMLCQTGFGPINGTVARFTAQYAAADQLGKVHMLHREVLRRVVRLALVGLAVGLVLLVWIAGLLRLSSLLPLLAGYGIIYASLLVGVSRGTLRGLQSFGQLSVNNVGESAGRLIVGVAILHYVTSAAGGLCAYLVALVLALLLAKRQLAELRSQNEPESIDGQPIKRFTGPMFLLMLTTAGFQNMDMLAVKHYFDSADAGIYGAAFTLARVINVAVTPFATLLLPLLTTLHEQGKAMAGAFIRTTGYFLLLAVVPVIAFLLWPTEIVRLMFGEPFSAAGNVLLVVTVTRLVGWLCHMIALAGAAANRFSALYIYTPSLVILLAVLSVRHDSPLQVVQAALAVQGLTLVALIADAIARRRAGNL